MAEDTTTIRMRRSVHAKLRRFAALEGLTLFELIDAIGKEFIASCEEAGYDLTPTDRRTSRLKIHSKIEKKPLK